MKVKSYTDLEQSKKLAEILPIESANMHYSKDYDGSWFVDLAEYTSVKIPKYVDNIEEHLLPCWSLAALLGVLPEIQGGKPIIALDDNYITYPHMSDLHTKADNIIDACYNMIIRLNELSLELALKAKKGNN